MHLVFVANRLKSGLLNGIDTVHLNCPDGEMVYCCQNAIRDSQYISIHFLKIWPSKGHSIRVPATSCNLLQPLHFGLTPVFEWREAPKWKGMGLVWDPHSILIQNKRLEALWHCVLRISVPESDSCLSRMPCKYLQQQSWNLLRRLTWCKTYTYRIICNICIYIYINHI